MGLLDRLNLLIRSEASARRSSRDGSSETVDDLQIGLRDARLRVTRVLRDEKHLEVALDNARQREQRHEDEAVRHLQDGNEDAARRALLDRNLARKETRRIQRELGEHRTYLADLLRALEALETKLDGVRGRHRSAPRPTRRERQTPPPVGREAVRELRGESADVDRWEALIQRRSSSRSRLDSLTDAPTARSAAAPSDFSFEASSASTAFDRLDESLSKFDAYADKVAHLDAEAEAEATLAGPFFDEDDPLYDPKLAELERRFRALERKGGDD